MTEQYDVCEECLRHYNSGKTGGLNCAETTLQGLATYLGLDVEAIYRIATPFGGGIGRNGYICGSLVSGLMVLGLKYGRDNMHQRRSPGYDRATILLEKFLEKHGTINCRDITGIDLKDEKQVTEKKEEIHETICRPLVAEVCRWVAEIIEADEAEDI